MTFPLWAIFGLCTAALSAANMLMQEKYKVNGFVLAFWNKVACVILTAPLVIYYGFPQEPRFYILVAFSSLLYAISDVVYFQGVSRAGAGTISRLVPAAVILNFLLWFAVDPVSFGIYLQQPVIAGLIFGVLCLWVYFAVHMRKCAVSMAALRTIWFVLFAAVIGPAIGKGVTNSTDISQGLYAFPFIGALMMIVMWSFFSWARRPMTSSVLFSYRTARYCLGMGSVNTLSVVLNCAAVYHVDNPAYSSAVGYLNAFFILVAYKLMGRKNDGNVMAGIGIALCAVMLIILKAQV